MENDGLYGLAPEGKTPLSHTTLKIEIEGMALKLMHRALKHATEATISQDTATVEQIILATRALEAVKEVGVQNITNSGTTSPTWVSGPQVSYGEPTFVTTPATAE